MNKDQVTNKDLEAFEEFLFVHGSDKTRWPSQDRRAYAALVATNACAAKLLREAELLDRFLDVAPPKPTHAQCEALADKITAAAFANETERATLGPRVINTEDVSQSLVDQERQAPPSGRNVPLAPTRKVNAPKFAAFAREEWPAAALLAASLLIGVMGGWTGMFNSALTPLMNMSEATIQVTDLATTAADPARLILDGGAGLITEELL